MFDFGSSLGTTSSLVPTAGNCGLDPAVCLASPFSSSRTFAMAAGDHSITIRLDQEFIGNSGGAFFFRVSSVPVPEPSVAALASLSALLLAWHGRGRRDALARC